MDRRFLTVLGISLLFALVVSTIFYQMTGRLRRAPQKVKQETQDLVVAASVLPVGAPIRPADVRVVKVPKEQFPKGAFGRIEEVTGRPVISKILAEEAVLEGRLAERGSGLGLAPVIPVGMRAVSVKVNDVVGVAGFVLPGVRVDVLVTVKPPGDAGARTTTVLQNIMVLSAGQHIEADARGQAINVPVVTLLVSPEQAELLTLAGTEGKVQLVLRNATDQGMEKTPGRQVTELYGMARRGPPERPPRPRPQQVAAAPPPALPEEIVVIRGTQKSVEVIGANRIQ
jgi:pilus assembly protein CpaB